MKDETDIEIFVRQYATDDDDSPKVIRKQRHLIKFNDETEYIEIWVDDHKVYSST